MLIKIDASVDELSLGQAFFLSYKGPLTLRLNKIELYGVSAQLGHLG